MESDRIRLNVSCVLHEESLPTDKFLVVVNRRHGMERLMAKIQEGLSGKLDQITRVLNNNGSILPIDEAIGDMLRDGDEIVALIGPQQGGLLIKASKDYLDGPGPKSPKVQRDVIPFEPIHRPEEPQEVRPTITIDDLEPYRLYDCDVNDWVVARLTPKIREFILARFRAAFVTEPKYVPSIKKFVGAKFYQASGSFISVFMKPRNRRGERDSPIQYNICKTDIKEFQRLVEKNIDSIQIHIDHLEATKDSLLGLLAQGRAETDHINVMLPYKYESWEKVEGVACTEILVPDLSGRNPIIIVDANGLKNRLPFLKSSLKRCIYANLPKKASFNMLVVHDKIIEYAADLCIPSGSALRKLDAFIEALPCDAKCDTHIILEALKKALALKKCDAITFIGGAIGCTDLVANSALLHNLHVSQKRLNKRIDVVAVDADAVGELFLRNIAEQNGGKFTMKRFHGVTAFNVAQTDEIWDGVKARILQDKWLKLGTNTDQHRLTIAGQIEIVEVMVKEEIQRDDFWKAEWACSKQLLEGPTAGGSTAINAFKVDMSATTQYRMRMKKELHSVRTGGGFLYQADAYCIPTPGRNPWEQPPRKVETRNKMMAARGTQLRPSMRGSTATTSAGTPRASSAPTRSSGSTAHASPRNQTRKARPKSAPSGKRVDAGKSVTMPDTSPVVTSIGDIPKPPPAAHPWGPSDVRIPRQNERPPAPPPPAARAQSVGSAAATAQAVPASRGLPAQTAEQRLERRHSF